MRKSASASRVSGHFSPIPPPSSPTASQFRVHSLRESAAASEDSQLLLPMYDPNSHAAKREQSRLRSAENAVHFIPFVLFLCGVILWSFSGPAASR